MKITKQQMIDLLKKREHEAWERLQAQPDPTAEDVETTKYRWAWSEIYELCYDLGILT